MARSSRFASPTKPVKKLAIILNGKKNLYGPGDVFSGLVSLETGTLLHIDDVRVTFHGEITVVNTTEQTQKSETIFNETLQLFSRLANKSSSPLPEGVHEWPFDFCIPDGNLPPSFDFWMSGPTDEQEVSDFIRRLLYRFICVLVPQTPEWSKSAFVRYDLEATVSGRDLESPVNHREILRIWPNRVDNLKARSLPHSECIWRTANQLPNNEFALVLHIPKFVVVGENWPIYLEVREEYVEKAAITLKSFKLVLHTNTMVGARPQRACMEGDREYVGESFLGPCGNNINVELKGRTDLRAFAPNFRLQPKDLEVIPQTGRKEPIRNGVLVPTFETTDIKRLYWLKATTVVECSGKLLTAQFQGDELEVLPFRRGRKRSLRRSESGLDGRISPYEPDDRDDIRILPRLQVQSSAGTRSIEEDMGAESVSAIELREMEMADGTHGDLGEMINLSNKRASQVYDHVTGR